MRVPVELERSYKLLNHGPTVLVSSAAHGRTNVMAAAWAMPIDFNPAKVAVVIAEGTFTRELVDASGEFTLSVPSRELADAVYAAGTLTGRDGDKWERAGLTPIPASRVTPPLVEGCVAWLECKVLPVPESQQRFDLFVAEVLAAWADDEVWQQNAWAFDGAPEARRTLHHLAGGSFFVTGGALQARNPGR